MVIDATTRNISFNTSNIFFKFIPIKNHLREVAKNTADKSTSYMLLAREKRRFRQSGLSLTSALQLRHSRGI